MKTRLLVVLPAAALTALPAIAQPPDTVRLDDVTVTATRVPVSRDMRAATVTVLDGDALRARGLVFVAEALRDVPGLMVVPTGSYGGATSVFLRGGESDYTQVLIDGVPVNEPGGSYDFAHLSLANVERIEILRGPGSVLYGSDGVTGVVNIITRQGEAGGAVRAGVSGGTHDTFSFDLDASGRLGSVGYTFGAQRFKSDGVYAFNNDYDITVVSGRVDLAPDDATDVTMTLRYRDSRYAYPTGSDGAVEDRNAVTLSEATTVGIDAGRWVAHKLEARIHLASNITSGGSDDGPDGPADTLGFYAFRSLQDLSRQSVDARLNFYPTGGVVMTAGAQVERQEERSFNESESQFGPSNGSSANERSNRAYYAQGLVTLRGWSVIAGARLDDNEAFGTFGTFRLAASYTFPTNMTVRGSVGRGFKAPTFFENYATGFVEGNPDLVPERTRTWEAGVRQRWADGRVQVEATYYNQKFRDLIQYTFRQQPNYANIAEADARGVEVEVAAEPGVGVRVVGRYSHTDTEVIDAGFDSGAGATFVDGERLLRRPTTQLGGSVDVSAVERVRFNVGVTYTGDRDDREFSLSPVPVVLPAYTTVDASVTAQVTSAASGRPGISMSLSAANLWDEDYDTVHGFPGRGRTLSLAVRMGR